MSNHDYIIANAVGATVRADINSALAAIATNNSSATEPATMYAYQWWADTTTAELKQRNAANTAWIIKANLADAFSNGTSTLTLTGCTTSPTINVNYVKIGKVITLSFAQDNVTGTSNSTAKTLTGLPSSLAPAVAYYDSGTSVDNGGTPIYSLARFGVTGTITLQPSPATATWTASGTMVWYPKSYTYITA